MDSRYVGKKVKFHDDNDYNFSKLIRYSCIQNNCPCIWISFKEKGQETQIKNELEGCEMELDQPLTVEMAGL